MNMSTDKEIADKQAKEAREKAEAEAKAKEAASTSKTSWPHPAFLASMSRRPMGVAFIPASFTSSSFHVE